MLSYLNYSLINLGFEPIISIFIYIYFLPYNYNFVCVFTSELTMMRWYHVHTYIDAWCLRNIYWCIEVMAEKNTLFLIFSFYNYFNLKIFGKFRTMVKFVFFFTFCSSKMEENSSILRFYGENGWKDCISQDLDDFGGITPK